MYHAEIVVAKQRSKQVHLEREFYTKTKASGLLSGATSIVAAHEEMVSESGKATSRRTKTSGKPESGEWYLVCSVDRMPVESGTSELVRGVQQHDPCAVSGVATQRIV